MTDSPSPEETTPPSETPPPVAPPPAMPPPPASPYQAPAPPPASPYSGGVQQKPSTVLSLLSMIFGIVGLVLVCCFGAGFLFSVAGIVLGHLGIRKEPARGMAMTGLVTGYIGTGLAILFWILLVAAPLLLVPFIAWCGYTRY